MTLHDWLKRPHAPMTATQMAEALGVSKTAVSLWQKNGVPMVYMPQIEQITGGTVTTAAMLDHALRCRMARRGHAVNPATAEPATA